jgi:hypothetical protein
MASHGLSPVGQRPLYARGKFKQRNSFGFERGRKARAYRFESGSVSAIAITAQLVPAAEIH